MIKTRDMILTSLFASLTAIGAFIKIPLPHVPLTLQVIFVFMAGLIMGKKLGALSQILYVGLGLAGVPIFTEGGGIGYIFKPSFGYLVGFILAAYITGFLMENKKATFKNTLISAIAGLSIIYISGIPYLYYILTRVMEVNISFYGTIKTGMLAFLPGDLLKILFVSLIVPRIKGQLENFQT